MSSSQLVRSAERTARQVLGPNHSRVAHAEGTARAACHLATGLGARAADALIAAAWLHDIGHAPGLVRTGFHPLDGALHLAGIGWPDDVVRLVAHHSFAAVLAPYYGVADHLTVLDPVPGRAADVLTFADIVSGSDGKGTTVKRRIDELRARNRVEDSPVPMEVHEVRYALLEQTALSVLRSSPSARVSMRTARV